ncbi:MAG: ATPase [Fibrobacter sp.]|jgi:predicted Fe-Mo cluster-binding NifX family protein|nr:ATPase [Fibrobacter sp.]
MKFAIPLADGKLTAHFGHCKSFAFIEVKDLSAPEIFQVTECEPPPHEPGVLPQWLYDNQITHVIAGGMGERARKLLEAKSIHVVVGAPLEKPEVLVSSFLLGKLEKGDNLCGHDENHICS